MTIRYSGPRDSFMDGLVAHMNKVKKAKSKVKPHVSSGCDDDHHRSYGPDHGPMCEPPYTQGRGVRQ